MKSKENVKPKQYTVKSLELTNSEIYTDVQEIITEKLDGVEENEVKTRKSERLRKEILHIQDPEVYEASFDDIVFLSVDDQSLWKEAMYANTESLKINYIWNLEKLPPDKQTISYKWLLFTIKRYRRYKNHLAHFFMQKERLD